MTILTPKYRTRVTSITSASSITPDIDTTDMYAVTALAETLTVNAPTGTPSDGQQLILRIKTDSTLRAISFNSIFQKTNVDLPFSLNSGSAGYYTFIYNGVEEEWDIVQNVNGEAVGGPV